MVVWIYPVGELIDGLDRFDRRSDPLINRVDKLSVLLLVPCFYLQVIDWALVVLERAILVLLLGKIF